jgi:hypothetical protein
MSSGFSAWIPSGVSEVKEWLYLLETGEEVESGVNSPLLKEQDFFVKFQMNSYHGELISMNFKFMIIKDKNV